MSSWEQITCPGRSHEGTDLAQPSFQSVGRRTGSLPPPVLELEPSFTQLRTPRDWLDFAQSCKDGKDLAGAISAFKTAALLYWDTKKAPQARACLKLALELSPGDEFLLAELKNFQSTDPVHDGPTRRITAQEAKALVKQLHGSPPTNVPVEDEEPPALGDFSQPTVVDLDLLGLRPR
jgi:hypothetical protein